MIIICLKTDQPKAYIGLYDSSRLLGEVSWPADRELSGTIYRQLQLLLSLHKLDIEQVTGFVCYRGPGSFTGLRIGLSVANGLAYAQDVAIVARKGKYWVKDGISALLAGRNERLALPYYGEPAKTTNQKK